MKDVINKYNISIRTFHRYISDIKTFLYDNYIYDEVVYDHFNKLYVLKK